MLQLTDFRSLHVCTETMHRIVGVLIIEVPWFRRSKCLYPYTNGSMNKYSDYVSQFQGLHYKYLSCEAGQVFLSWGLIWHPGNRLHYYHLTIPGFSIRKHSNLHFTVYIMLIHHSIFCFDALNIGKFIWQLPCVKSFHYDNRTMCNFQISFVWTKPNIYFIT